MLKMTMGCHGPHYTRDELVSGCLKFFVGFVLVALVVLGLGYAIEAIWS